LLLQLSRHTGSYRLLAESNRAVANLDAFHPSSNTIRFFNPVTDHSSDQQSGLSIGLKTRPALLQNKKATRKIERP
jgi:hypothetical protein